MPCSVCAQIRTFNTHLHLSRDTRCTTTFNDKMMIKSAHLSRYTTCNGIYDDKMTIVIIKSALHHHIPYCM